jgi:hypothetical protein
MTETRTTDAPVFAVVGHPNKGKSSIVATLARDDRIAISPRSGTTTRSGCWSFENAGGRYQLVDTPGFQRPRAVLEWLQARAGSADQRAAAVAALVADPGCRERFPDETELLRPIVAGAAILYVVDGSRPYSPEYEAEMEILRWSGQPSMGLINPIEGEAHVAEWQQALQQYFRLVRVFDPMQPQLEVQARLLTAFAHLQPDWAHRLEAIAAEIETEPERRLEQAAQQLALWLDQACTLSECREVIDRSLIPATREALRHSYPRRLKQAEQQVFAELLGLYRFHQGEIEAGELEMPGDLLDREQWRLWGLDRRQLLASAAGAGASAGAVIDAGLLGHSLMTGALIGGLAGLGSAWFGSDRLQHTRLSSLAGGRWRICAGPSRDRNLPFVLIARYGWLLDQLEQRTHAWRGPIRLQGGDWKQRLEALEDSQRKALFSACERLSKQKTVDDLPSRLLPLLRQFRGRQ